MASVFIMAWIVDNLNWMTLIYPCIVLACYMSAANILNDLVDIQSDSINKPDRALVRHPVNRYLIILIIGLLFLTGSIVSMCLPQEAMRIAIFFALPGILLYELILKRIPLLGNMLVSLLVGSVFLFVASSLESHIDDALKIMLLAFSLNLLREIVKDIQDIVGDKASGLRTLPIFIGVSKTIFIIRGLALVFILISFLPMYTQVYAWHYIPLMVFLIHVPLLYIIIGLGDDITPKECTTFSNILKLMIINGIVIILLSAK
jgi:4-hydroxybenzoate polyprenyltransferase